MPRNPSLETQIRNLKRELNQAGKNERYFKGEASRLSLDLKRSEENCTAWRKRFDALLFCGYKAAPASPEGRVAT